MADPATRAAHCRRYPESTPPRCLWRPPCRLHPDRRCHSVAARRARWRSSALAGNRAQRTRQVGFIRCDFAGFARASCGSVLLWACCFSACRSRRASREQLTADRRRAVRMVGFIMSEPGFTSGGASLEADLLRTAAAKPARAAISFPGAASRIGNCRHPEALLQPEFRHPGLRPEAPASLPASAVANSVGTVPSRNSSSMASV